MSEYIFISYVVMMLVMIKYFLFDDVSFKDCFKWWVTSPLSLPYFLILTFVGW